MTKTTAIFLVFLGICVVTNAKTLKEELKAYTGETMFCKVYFTHVFLLGTPRDDLGDIIKKVVKCIIENLKKEDNILGIPPIDPLKIDSFQLSLNEEILR